MREGYTRSRARFSSHSSSSGDRGYAPQQGGGGNSFWKFAIAVVVIVVLAAVLIMFKDPILSAFGLGSKPAPTPAPSVKTTSTPKPTPEPTETPEATETPTPEPTATPTPTPQPATDVKISSVGGIFMDSSDELKSAKDSSSGEYDFTSMFAEIKDGLMNSDLALGTLETTFAGKDAGYSSSTKYNTPETLLAALKGIGFKALDIASYHIFDKKMDGVKSTKKFISDAGITPVGIYDSVDDYRAARTAPQLLNVNGIQVAVLAYSDTGKYESTLSAADRDYVIRHIDPITIQKDITAARQAGAQVVVVMACWQKETDKTPSSDIQDDAKKIIGYGADLIIGSGPSAVQKIEKIDATTDSGTHSGIVAYSLGNFISGQKSRDNGIILDVTFENDPSTNSISIKDVTYTPTYTFVDSDKAYSILPVNKYLDSDDLLKSLTSSAKKRIQTVWDTITNLVGSTDDYHPAARSTQ